MREERYKQQSDKTANYYNDFQHGYNDVYGDMIQAFRPSDSEELMRSIVVGADLYSGQSILDAGCGIAGPATWLATNMDVTICGVTISEVQAREAAAKVTKRNLTERINIIQGDYHELSRLVSQNTFDRVLFLESLGHAGAPDVAIAEAFTILKPGGAVYIKDFYYKEPKDPVWSERIKKVISNINRYYSYNTLNLEDTIHSLRGSGFEIDFVRKFNFKDDISIRFEFEKRFEIDIFGGEPEFAPAEWLEIKCTKPLQ